MKPGPLSVTVAVDMTDFEKAIARAHAELDRLEARTAALPEGLVSALGIAVSVTASPRKLTRRSLLGFNWWLR